MSASPYRVYPAHVAPTAGETITLCEYPDLVSLGIIRVIITFYSVNQASAALGLKAYASSDGGVTWDQVDFNSTMPVTAAATSAGVDHRHDFDVVGYLGFRVTYTAGVVASTVWRMSAVGLRGIRDSGN